LWRKLAENISSFKKNNRWIIDNYDQLAEKFQDQWVAVMNFVVLDHDKDIRKLVDRLKAQHLGDYKQIAVDFISSQEVETEVPLDLWG